MLTFFLVWIALSGSITAAACVSIAKHQRRPGLMPDPRYYADSPSQVAGSAAHPTIEADEFMREGRPLDPPEFVPDGLHPTIAARQRTRIEGIRYTTRRVIKEVH